MAERPTPHSIAVCTLIALQSDPTSPSLSVDGSKHHISHHDIEVHLSSLLQRLVVVSNNTSSSSSLSWERRDDEDEERFTMLLLKETSLTKLLQRVAGHDGSFHPAADALLQDLQQSCASVDALEDLFVALEASVTKGRVDGNSVYGIYVRKQCLGFHLLPFESVVRLSTALTQYVDQHVSSLSLVEQHNSFLQNLPEHHHQQQQQCPLMQLPQQWPLSEAQIIIQLMNQCRLVQQGGDTLSFETVEVFLQQILCVYPELIVALFLRYLNCYFHDEKVAALDHLHRYFDYAMIVERKERLANGPSSSTSTPVYHSVRNIVQYAPILLGTLFYRLGHVSMARKAIEEALRIAQQTGDGVCIAYALAWLYATNNTDTTTGSTRSSLYVVDPSSLRQASQRAIEFPLQSLFVGTCVQQARHLLDYGAQPIMRIHNRDGPDFNKIPIDFSILQSSQTSRVIPALAWDHLAAATVFESPQGGYDASSSSLRQSTVSTAFLADMPCHLQNLEHSENVCQTLIQQRLMSSALWAALGHFPMSHIHNRIGLDSYHNLVSADQASDAALQSMARVRYGPGFPFSFSSFITDVNRGNIYCVDRISDSMVLYCQAFVHNEWCTYKKDWFNAKDCQRILHSSAPTLFKYGIEYLIDALGSSAIFYIQQKYFDKAKNLLDKLCELCDQHSLHSRNAYYLLQKSIMYLSIHDPMGALPSLLSCLSLCDSKMLDSIHSAALSLLAQIFYETDNIASSQSILKAALPRLVQYGMIWFVGESWLTLAKCCLGEKSSDSSSCHDTNFRMALSHLCQAEEAFHALDDTTRLHEVYYLKSRVYNQLGNKVKRNLEAQKFHVVKQRMDSYYYPKWAVTSRNI